MSGFSVVLIVIFVCITCGIWIVFNLAGQAWAVYQKVFTATAENNLERMFLFFDIKKMFFTNILLLFGLPLLVYLFTSNWFYTGLTFVVVMFAPKVTYHLMSARRKQKIAEGIPDALAQISGSMRSGSTFTAAIENMVNETKGPISQEFSLMVKEQKLGISQKDALENLGDRVGLEELDLVVAASLIARDVGGNLSETFDRLSVMLRRKIEMEGKIKALTSQGKMQGWVVGALPFGIMLALVYVEPQGIMPMFSTFLGWGFLAAIIALEVMGAIIIRKIVSIDV